MAVTRASYLEAYPEFANCATSLVDAKLASAELRTGELWGDLRDDAVMLLASHLISLDPRAEGSARAPLQAGSAHYGSSLYLRELERLRAEARCDMFGTVGGC